MRAVGVVGESDAGKTTLIERLIPVLGERGRVATVKSIHHDIEIDEEGTDTCRHRAAGAGTVVGVTPSLTVTFEPAGKDDHGDDGALLRGILRDLEGGGFDYALVEGFAASPIPKLVVGDPVGGAGRVVERVVDAETVAIEGIADGIDRLPEWDGT